MNFATTTHMDRLLQQKLRPARFVANVVEFDAVTYTARLAPVAGTSDTVPALLSQPIPLAPGLRVIANAIIVGTQVVVERLGGRRWVIVDLARYVHTDPGNPRIGLDQLDFGDRPVVNVVWQSDTGTGTVSWLDGFVVFQNQRYPVFAGSTALLYIVWDPMGSQLVGTDTLPTIHPPYLIGYNNLGVVSLAA